MTPTAYVDEFEPGDRRDPGAYILAAAILPPTSRSERRRRVALERLLFELLAVGIDSVVLESRVPADRRDRAHVDALRGRRMIGSVWVDHVAGAADPLLWAADAACGLIAQDRREESARRGLFDDRMVVHEVRR